MLNGIGIRWHTFAQLRALVQLTVINRRPTQLDPQRASPCGHHRTGVRAVPGWALCAPALQCESSFTQQGVGQRHQPGRNVVEHVVDLRSGPAEALETFVAITPHGVERVAQAVEHHAWRAGHGKPEQRGEDSVTAVFQDRFSGGAGHFGGVQLRSLATDQVTNPLARLLQIVATQGLGDRLDVLPQAAQAKRAIEGKNLDDPPHIRRPGKSRGEQGQGHDRHHPGSHAMAAPAATTPIETLFDAIGKTAERHQRMPAFGFTQQRIQRNRGDTQQRHTH
ncbi:hypothetical protein D3C73_1094770 [compost metagenome]